MYFEEIEGLKIGRFPVPKDVVFAFSTRIGGVSAPPFQYLNLGLYCGDRGEKVMENRRRFFHAIGVDPELVAQGEQVHGSHVQRIEAPGYYEKADALVTDNPDVFLTVSVADCVPIFYLDPIQRVLGAVHAGWRGTKERIAEKTLKMMVKEFGTRPEDVLVLVGPHIGSCCYTVMEKSDWNKEFLKKKGIGHWHLDLWAANKKQLLALGVRESHIAISGLCTKCQRQLFYSYRRDGRQTGRMLGIIGFKG